MFRIITGFINPKINYVKFIYKMDKLSCSNICGQAAKNNLQMFQCKSILCPQTVYKKKITPTSHHTQRVVKNKCKKRVPR